VDTLYPLLVVCGFTVPTFSQSTVSNLYPHLVTPIRKQFILDIMYLGTVEIQTNNNNHYCLVSLMWMKIGSNDITAQMPGVS
jgi:hypothetical protein